MANNRYQTWREHPNLVRRQVIRIDVLPDDILLGIFDLYLGVTPLFEGKTRVEEWQLLVHVCRRWRSLVLGSPRRLNLRLFCTPQTPARDTLDVWPALPLVVRGYMAFSSSTDHTIAALEQSSRVCEIYLTNLGDQQLEEVLTVMQVPFPELTDLRLLSDEQVLSVISVPDSFLDGSAPHLRVFVLAGIPFPGFPKLLASAIHLDRIYLQRIPHSGYISPEAMVTLLTVLSNLRILFLEFQSPQSRPDSETRSLPPPERSTLPALDRFEFKGVTEYLEDLVTCIDTPRLIHIDITFFNQIDFDCPRLAQFINRTPTLRAHDEAHVYFSDSSTGVNLQYQKSKSGLRAHKLRIAIPLKEPDWQLSSIEQVCNSSLPPFSVVLEDLYINHRYQQLVWKNDAIEDSLWLQLLLPFTTVKNLYLSNEFAPGFAAALKELVGMTEVLPSLQNIFVEGLHAVPPYRRPFRENLEHFVAARQLSGHPIVISVWNNPAR